MVAQPRPHGRVAVALELANARDTEAASERCFEALAQLEDSRVSRRGRWPRQQHARVDYCGERGRECAAGRGASNCASRHERATRMLPEKTRAVVRPPGSPLAYHEPHSDRTTSSIT